MKGALIAGLLAAFVAVAANVVSNHMNDPMAWFILFIIVCIASIIGHLVEKKVSKNQNTINIIGAENEIEQKSGDDTSQEANVIGKKNKIKQTVK